MDNDRKSIGALRNDIDEDSVDCTAATKDHILERLNKRNKDRQNYLDVKLEQRNKVNLKLEGADYFARSFAERVHAIEIHMQTVRDESNTRTNKNSDTQNADLICQFADITVEIQELERYVTTSTMFLSDFKIKACQNIIKELTSSCEELRQSLMPKKKFGFSGRKVAPKTVLNPKLNIDKLDASDKSAILKTTSAAFTWTLSNRKDEYICLRDDEVNNTDVTISNLTNCFVELQGHAGSVQISKAKNCTFLCGPIARSLFAEECQHSTLALACQQLRLHSSSACRIHLHVTCRAIIEDCKQIEIGPYNYNYDSIERDFQKAGLDKTQNNYTDVADFNWLSPDVHSPNWQLLIDGDAADLSDWNELRDTFKKTLSNNKIL